MINFRDSFPDLCYRERFSEDNALFNIFSLSCTSQRHISAALVLPHVRVVARACTANGPELKSLASGRFRLGARRVSEVHHVHFSSARQEIAATMTPR